MEKSVAIKCSLNIPKLVREVMIVESERISQKDGQATKEELLKR